MRPTIFINADDRTVSTRQKEETESLVKSHAARIAHQRARTQRNPNRSVTDRKVQPHEIVFDIHDPFSSRTGPGDRARNILRQRPARVTPTTSSGQTSLGEYVPTSTAGMSFALQTRAPASPPVSEMDRVTKMFWEVLGVPSAQFSAAMKCGNYYDHNWLHLLQDEAFFHVGAAIIKHGYDELICPIRPSPDILHHKIEALRLIRNRIDEFNGVTSVPTLLAVLYFPGLVDSIAEIDPLTYWNAIIMHWNGFRKLLAAHLQAFPDFNDPYAIAAINIVGTYHHTHMVERANLDRNLSLPTGLRFLEPRCSPDVPYGFRTLDSHGLVSSVTIQMVHNLMSVLDEQKSDRRGIPDSSPIFEDKNPVLTIQWGPLENKISSTIREPLIDALLPGALLMYTCRAVMDGPHIVNHLTRPMLRDLVHRLVQCTAKRSKPEENAMFWAWVVAILAHKTKFQNLSLNGCKLRDLHVERFSKEHTKQEARVVLEQFFCDEELWADYERLILRSR